MGRTSIKGKPRGRPPGRPKSNTTAKNANKSNKTNNGEHLDNDASDVEEQQHSSRGTSSSFEVLVDNQDGEFHQNEYEDVGNGNAVSDLKRKRNIQHGAGESDDEGVSDVATENAGDLEYELTTPADKIDASPTSSEKRGRGRPPKKQKVGMMSFSPAQTYSTPGTERGRGRPPKFPTSYDSPLALKTASRSEPRTSMGSTTGRGRGRPPKNKSSPKAKGKVGRPRKSVDNASPTNLGKTAPKEIDNSDEEEDYMNADEGVEVDEDDGEENEEEEEDVEIDEPTITIAPTQQRRGPGRPPKKVVAPVPVPVSAEDEQDDYKDDEEGDVEVDEDEEGASAQKVKGGEKSMVIGQVDTVKEVVTVTESAPRRGPGRPRKNAILPPVVRGATSFQEGSKSVNLASNANTKPFNQIGASAGAAAIPATAPASNGKRPRGRPKKSTQAITTTTTPAVAAGMMEEDIVTYTAPYNSPEAPMSPPSINWNDDEEDITNALSSAVGRTLNTNNGAYEASEFSNNETGNNNVTYPTLSSPNYMPSDPPHPTANTADESIEGEERGNLVQMANSVLVELANIRQQQQQHKQQPLQTSSDPLEPEYTPSKPPASRKASTTASVAGSRPVSAGGGGGNLNVQQQQLQSPNGDGRGEFQSPRPGSKDRPGIISTFFSKMT